MSAEEYAVIEGAALAYEGPYRLGVSVVIPHHNTHEFLSRCIAGLSAQTYPRSLLEVVISDDGSDRVPFKSELALADSLDLRIIAQSRCGRRTAAARNRAIEAATREVIICIDADIIPVEQFIEAHMRYYHVARQIATVGPRKFIDVTGIDPNSVPKELPGLRHRPDVCSVSNHGYPLDGRIPFFERFQHERSPYWFYYSCNIGFWREDALRIGMFDPRFDGHWGYEDIDYGYRLFLNGNVIVYVPDAVALHQENQATSAKQREDDGEVNLARLIAKWPNLDDEEPDTLSGPQATNATVGVMQ